MDSHHPHRHGSGDGDRGAHARALLDAAVKDQASEADPTGTARIRARMRREARRHYQEFIRRLREAVLERDILGIGSSDDALFAVPLSPEARLDLFNRMIIPLIYASLVQGGRWLPRYIEQAYQSGDEEARNLLNEAALALLAAAALLPFPISLEHAQQQQIDLLTTNTTHELEGIANATVQQFSRAASDAVIKEQKPGVFWRILLGIGAAVTVNRLNAMSNTSVVKAHNEARLDTFEAAGVKAAGIIPEVLYDVQTAGDDLVCEICQGWAEGGPYQLARVRGLIPIHPNCRCALVPA